MRHRRRLFTLALALWLAATSALAVGRGATPPRRRRERRAPPSLSMGYANSGRLQNGVRLDEDETLRYVPGRPLHYGTDELVGLIRRAARAVHRRHRGARLNVGDLSAPRGGPVGHHASHQSGRDADLGFYVLGRRGEPVALDDYVGFNGDGRAMASPALRFDTARNWALVEALVDDPVVRVEHIFVSRPLRALLLDYARGHGASASAIARAAAVMHQPTHASPHANHFHVRIACPAGDAACVEGVRVPPRPRRRRGRGAQVAEARHHRGGHGHHDPRGGARASRR